MLDELKLGETLLRREVHERFGGRQQGGIGPSRTAPVVLFFTDPSTGHQHGYYDGIDDDGLFNYVGEGQRGDQRLVQGNKSIEQHVKEGRTLEGFVANGRNVTYLGEFTLVDYHFTEAHESGNTDVLRQVIVFRLRPTGELPVTLPHIPVTRSPSARVESVAVEEQYTERAFITPDREPYQTERAEARLVHRYRDHLTRQGHTVTRLRILPPEETAPLYTDLWDDTTHTLIEAKGGITREQVRTAVGQLLDYNRFINAQHLTVLLPSKPRPDLINYLHSAGMTVTYETGTTYTTIPA